MSYYTEQLSGKASPYSVVFQKLGLRYTGSFSLLYFRKMRLTKDMTSPILCN